jgi:hypothetical protein
VKRGRRIGTQDQVTWVAHFYLETDSLREQVPPDRAGLKNDSRIGAIRFSGPSSTSATVISPEWQTIVLSYQNYRLQEISWKDTARKFRFDYYAFDDGNYWARGRIKTITYPSGGQAGYEYAKIDTFNASCHPAEECRYVASDGVRKRTLDDKVTPGMQTWEFYSGSANLYDETELAASFVIYTSNDANDPGYLVETMYEPLVRYTRADPGSQGGASVHRHLLARPGSRQRVG